jgi:hypothetical protein
MNRLTKLIDNGLDEIYFEVPSDREGLYNIVDVAELLDDDERDEILFRIAERLKVYEDTGLEPEDILSNIKFLSNELNNALEKLAEYEDLEEQGLLIKLPCKVGDTVYQIMYDRTIENYKVVGFEIDERGKLFVRVLIERPAATIKLSYRKEDLFLTREEAEKALEEMK